MKQIVLVFGLVALLCGCAAIKQGINDYQVGKQTPLVNGEIAPKDQAAPIVSTASALPIVGPFAGILGIVLTGFFTWQRGVAIRKNGSVTPQVVVSHNIFTGILQDVANIAAGAFTTSTSGSLTGSVIQRVWKVALATIASGVGLAATNQDFQTYLLAHPALSLAFVTVSAGIAGLEKALSNVAPVAPGGATTGSNATTTVINV